MWLRRTDTQVVGYPPSVYSLQFLLESNSGTSRRHLYSSPIGKLDFKFPVGDLYLSNNFQCCTFVVLTFLASPLGSLLYWPIWPLSWSLYQTSPSLGFFSSWHWALCLSLWLIWQSLQLSWSLQRAVMFALVYLPVGMQGPWVQELASISKSPVPNTHIVAWLCNLLHLL